MRFAGGLGKPYPVDRATACGVREALANGQQGFLAFDAAVVAAGVKGANPVWTQVIFDPDPIIDDGGNGAGEAALIFGSSSISTTKPKRRRSMSSPRQWRPSSTRESHLSFREIRRRRRRDHVAQLIIFGQ
jgi:hypothetical protein